MPKLTQKQAAFVREYLIDLNATQAAIRAGYSKKTAHPMGAENLQKPTIAAAVNKALKKRALKVERTAEEVIERLWNFSDIDEEEYRNNHNNKSTELLAKHHKLLNERMEVDVTGSLNINLVDSFAGNNDTV